MPLYLTLAKTPLTYFGEGVDWGCDEKGDAVLVIGVVWGAYNVGLIGIVWGASNRELVRIVWGAFNGGFVTIVWGA